MNIASLTRNWTESLTFLRWETAKLLLLVTLNTFVRSLRLMIKHFWWLIASIFIMTALGQLVPEKLAIPLFISLEMLLLLCFFLGARPSLENKDFEYFNKYINFGFKFKRSKLGLGSFIFVLWFLFFIFSPLLCFMRPLVGGFVTFFVQPIFLYAFFFYLDSDLSARFFFPSIKRGFQLFYNFLPGIIVFNAVLGLITAITTMFITFYGFGYYFEALSPFNSMLISIVPSIIFKTLSLSLACLSISLTSTLYTKIKHSHYSLFFERK